MHMHASNTFFKGLTLIHPLLGPGSVFGQSTPTPVPCVVHRATAVEQKQIFNTFVEEFYVKRDIPRAFTHIAADYIQHNPLELDGITSSFDFLFPIFLNTSVTVQILHRVFEAPYGWLHYRWMGFWKSRQRFWTCLGLMGPDLPQARPQWQGVDFNVSPEILSDGYIAESGWRNKLKGDCSECPESQSDGTALNGTAWSSSAVTSRMGRDRGNGKISVQVRRKGIEGTMSEFGMRRIAGERRAVARGELGAEEAG
ncbi:hypothetical protein B0H13DRAFT_1915496 [Mycena leptocephala]|nr:hypothetical protein B0H13DRAFT_1915496 [Mycena leptocephala]